MILNQDRCSLMARKPAHRGVLLPEFGSRVLEVLRQPMEDKVVTISRAQGSLLFIKGKRECSASLKIRFRILHTS